MSSTLEAVRAPVAMERPASSERWRWLRLLFRRKIALIGAILVTINVVVAVLAPAIGRWDPLLLDVKARLAASAPIRPAAPSSAIAEPNCSAVRVCLSLLLTISQSKVWPGRMSGSFCLIV